jgi:hypothetical protein
MPHSPIYILQLNTSPNKLNPTITFYTKGIRPSMIALDKAYSWEISRYTLTNGKPVNCIISHQFIAFQRLWRAYSVFRRRVKSLFFLERELTGERLDDWRPPIKGSLYAVAVAVSNSDG